MAGKTTAGRSGEVDRFTWDAGELILADEWDGKLITPSGKDTTKAAGNCGIGPHGFQAGAADTQEQPDDAEAEADQPDA